MTTLALGLPFGKNLAASAAVDPGLALLQSAVLWLDASDPGADPQKVQNKGTGGTALDARYGSTTGVDTNDPLLLTHTGTNYLYLPGSANNNATIPDSAALSVTTGLEVVVRVAPDVWATNAPIISKTGSSGNYSWYLYTGASGELRLGISGNGTATGVSISSANVAFSAGQAGWIKATYRNSDSRVQFFTAADQATEPSSWTQLGTNLTNSQTTIFDSTAPIYIGSDNNAAHRSGIFYRCIVRDGPDGTIVLDANFTTNTNQSSFTESSSNAATVTINRATSGRKSVMVVRPTLLFSTDDYLEVANNALLNFAAGESFTTLVVARKWANVVSYGTFLSKNASGGLSAGYSFLNETATSKNILSIADGSVQVYSVASAATFILGTMSVMAGVRDTAADTVNSWTNTTSGTAASDTTTATLVNSNPLLVGRANGGTPYYVDAEITHVAIFRSALTSTELGHIATYLGV